MPTPRTALVTADALVLEFAGEQALGQPPAEQPGA